MECLGFFVVLLCFFSYALVYVKSRENSKEKLAKGGECLGWCLYR